MILFVLVLIALGVSFHAGQLVGLWLLERPGNPDHLIILVVRASDDRSEDARIMRTTFAEARMLRLGIVERSRN